MADFRQYEVIEKVGNIEVFKFITKNDPLINIIKNSLNDTKEAVQLSNQNCFIYSYLLEYEPSMKDSEYELLAVYCKKENV